MASMAGNIMSVLPGCDRKCNFYVGFGPHQYDAEALKLSCVLNAFLTNLHFVSAHNKPHAVLESRRSPK